MIPPITFTSSYKVYNGSREKAQAYWKFRNQANTVLQKSETGEIVYEFSIDKSGAVNEKSVTLNIPNKFDDEIEIFCYINNVQYNKKPLS